MWIGKTKKGKDVTLLTPSEKYEKYTKEKKSGYKYTNSGRPKLNEKKQWIKLSSEEKAYRDGYRAHAIDSSKVYNSKNNKKKTSRY
ncbi:MAG: hypothetical protein R3Y32_06690 [Bacillota bacterium]